MPYTTKEEILQLGVIDPEFEETLRTLNLPPLDWSDVNAFVASGEKRTQDTIALLGPPPPTVQRTELTYPTADGTHMRAVLNRPTHPPANGSPLIVLFHGGGFCIGSPESEEQTARNLVQAFGAVVLCPAYRMAPKYPFPYAVKDSWDALRYAAANAKSLGADTSQGFIVGGTSAGANISAVLAHVARDEALSPPLTAQYLAIPPVCSQSKIPEKYKGRMFSWEQNRDAPVLPVAAIDMLIGAYKPDEEDAVWFNTMLHPKGHRGLPKAFIQVDGMDPLRDEGLIYESILREEGGVETKMEVYPGVPHGHWGFFPQLKASQRFRKEQVEGFGWLLGRESVLEETETKVPPTTV